MNDVVRKAFDEITSASDFYKKKGPGNPRLLVMSGLPMSGKSYLSNMISKMLEGKICIVRTDYIRPIVSKHMGRIEPLYDKLEHAQVFELGRHLVGRALEKGWSVIADATNLKDDYRKWAVDAAPEHVDQNLVAFLEISVEMAMERSKEKERDGSAATPAVYALLGFENEPVEKCTLPYITINSEEDIVPWADMLAKWLTGEIDRVPRTVEPRIRKIPSARLR